MKQKINKIILCTILCVFIFSGCMENKSFRYFTGIKAPKNIEYIKTFNNHAWEPGGIIFMKISIPEKEQKDFLKQVSENKDWKPIDNKKIDLLNILINTEVGLLKDDFLLHVCHGSAKNGYIYEIKKSNLTTNTNVYERNEKKSTTDFSLYDNKTGTLYFISIE